MTTKLLSIKLTFGVNSMSKLRVDASKRFNPTLEFPCSKRQVIEWCAKELVSFDNTAYPTHAAPCGWAWFESQPREYPALKSEWYLIRVHPSIDMHEKENTVTIEDVLNFSNGKRYTILDVHDAAAATIHALPKRT